MRPLNSRGNLPGKARPFRLFPGSWDEPAACGRELAQRQRLARRCPRWPVQHCRLPLPERCQNCRALTSPLRHACLRHLETVSDRNEGSEVCLEPWPGLCPGACLSARCCADWRRGAATARTTHPGAEGSPRMLHQAPEQTSDLLPAESCPKCHIQPLNPPLHGMQQEIPDPRAAVLTGTPSHTLSQQRGMTRWPTDLPGMHQRDAMHNHRWAAGVWCLTGPLWHPPAHSHSAKPGHEPGRCCLGELPRGATGQAEVQPPP